MLRNFRQVFKGNQTPTAIIMLAVALSMLAYLAPSQGAAQAPDSVVARVYGRDILRRDVDEALGDMLQRMGKQANIETMLPFMSAQAMRQLMNQRLSEELAERHGVVVTDPEVKERLVANLKKYPVFLEADGRLKSTAQIEEVLRVNGLSLARWEREARASLVYGKLIQQSAALVPVDETTLALAHRAKTEKVAFESVSLTVDPSTVADPGDAKLEAFLKEGGARFQTGPRRVVQAVVVDQAALGDAAKVDDAAVKAAYDAKKASYLELQARHILFKASTDAEAAEALKKAQETLAKLKGGADFAKLADALTEDPSGKGRGGDLGWFKSGAMVKPFEDAAMALKPGQISEPVRTSFGVHLIRLDGRREKAFDEVKDALRADLSRERVATKAKEKLEALRKRTGDRGDLGPAARALNLKLETSAPFPAEGPVAVPGLGSPGTILGEAFRMKVGDVSKVQEAMGKFFVFRVIEEKPVGVPPLAEIRGAVLTSYQLEEARKALAAKAAEALKTDFKAVGPVATQAETTLEALGDLAQHPAIRKALLETAPGAVTPILWTADGKLWVARITARTPAPALTFETRRELVQKLQDSGAEKLLTAELQDLDAKGRLRPGLSSLWGRSGGIWVNPLAGQKGADLEN